MATDDPEVPGLLRNGLSSDVLCGSERNLKSVSNETSLSGSFVSRLPHLKILSLDARNTVFTPFT
jgi:hypothetical protein